jgi:hypothetical protein
MIGFVVVVAMKWVGDCFWELHQSKKDDEEMISSSTRKKRGKNMVNCRCKCKMNKKQSKSL